MKIRMRLNDVDPQMVEMYIKQGHTEYLMGTVHVDMLEPNLYVSLCSCDGPDEVFAKLTLVG